MPAQPTPASTRGAAPTDGDERSHGAPPHPHLSGLQATYTCWSGCGERYPLTEVRYRCARCGGLLDVQHDVAALKGWSGAAWRGLFDRRALRARPEVPLPASGVWSKREWVYPTIEDAHIVSLGEGETSLCPLPRLGERLGVRDLWIKQCGHGPTGSFKDLGMTVLVSVVNQINQLRRAGGGTPIPAVACASTGDTSAALAAYAAAAGIPALVFLPAGKVSDEQLTQPLASHALTAALDTDFDGCMALCAAFCERHGVYLANSMNPLRMEGQKTLAVEVCQQLGWQAPDVLVVPGGNLGNVTAIGKGFALLVQLGLIERAPRLVVAQAAHADPLYRAFMDGWRYQPQTARPTQASAIRIGAPVNVHKAIATLQQNGGLVGEASEDEITAACLMGDRHGLYADPHTGVALAVLAKLVAAGSVSQSARVVVVSTAHGLKFGALKRDFHTGALSTESDPLADARNRPLLIPASLQALEDTLLPRLQRG